MIVDPKKNSPKNEHGNVIFMILIAIAIFGALSFAVSDMLRSGQADTISDEKAKMLANEILDYGRAVKQAVQTTRISGGCGDTGVSLNNSIVSGYAHSPVVANSCKAFHEDGGGASYVVPRTVWLDSTQSAQTLYGEWYFSGDDRVTNLGNNTTVDLIAFLPWIKQSVCEKINEKLGIGSTTSEAWAFATGNKFTGTYGSSGRIIGTTGTDLDAEPVGCVTDTNGGYFFYQALISR